jgi:hypothetical protein
MDCSRFFFVQISLQNYSRQKNVSNKAVIPPCNPFYSHNELIYIIIFLIIPRFPFSSSAYAITININHILNPLNIKSKNCLHAIAHQMNLEQMTEVFHNYRLLQTAPAVSRPKTNVSSRRNRKSMRWSELCA